MSILSRTNKMRHNWSGHGGVVGQEEAQLRNERLLAEVQNLRGALAEAWVGAQLIYALHCRPRRGVFENEIAILMGSNSDFLKELRLMSAWLDVELLYLSRNDSGPALQLLPLVKVGPAPQSAKDACCFFNRLDQDSVRFVSCQFTDKPVIMGQLQEALKALRGLVDLCGSSPHYFARIPDSARLNPPPPPVRRPPPSCVASKNSTPA